MEQKGVIAPTLRPQKCSPSVELEGLITRRAGRAARRPHVFDTHMRMSGLFGGAAQCLRCPRACFHDRPHCSATLRSVWSFGTCHPGGLNFLTVHTPSSGI